MKEDLQLVFLRKVFATHRTKASLEGTCAIFTHGDARGRDVTLWPG